MTILDIDLDAFVSPVVHFRNDCDERPSNNGHRVASEKIVGDFLKRQCCLNPTICGVAVEHHVGVLDKVAALIERGQLSPPFTWVHVDAHDDLWGHYSRPPNSGNFLYHCIRRSWLKKLIMVFPVGEFDFPAYVLCESPLSVAFDRYSVPLEFSDIATYEAKASPDFVLLARSPAFTPPEADSLYGFIRSQFAECPAVVLSHCST